MLRVSYTRKSTSQILIVLIQSGTQNQHLAADQAGSPLGSLRRIYCNNTTPIMLGDIGLLNGRCQSLRMSDHAGGLQRLAPWTSVASCHPSAVEAAVVAVQLPHWNVCGECEQASAHRERVTHAVPVHSLCCGKHPTGLTGYRMPTVWLLPIPTSQALQRLLLYTAAVPVA